MDSIAAAALAGTVAAAAALGVCAAWHKRRMRHARRAERAREQELLERLAGGLAHELKNPLGALSLNLQLLEEELKESGRLSEASAARMAAITKDYHRFEDVLNNFLRYAARRQMVMAETDLSAIADEIVTFVKPDIARGGIALKLLPAAEPVPCRIDAPLVKQALLNVVLNAIEAMPGTGGTLELSTAREDGFGRISVRDTGVGISSEDLGHVFDAYFSKKKNGTGLGLAITRRIIEDHDGRIEVESTPGRGTTVSILLPVEGPARPKGR